MSPFLAESRNRILADFRDFKWSWRGALRWTAITLGAFIVAALVILYFLDWNEMRGPVARYASFRLGREVRIDGDLKVDLFRWQPHVSVAGLRVADPAWAHHPQGASVKQADVEFRLVPAIFGNWTLPLLSMDGLDVLVVRDPQGRTNWDGDGTSTFRIPPIQRFLIRNGHVQIDDMIRKLKFSGTVSSSEDINAGSNAFTLAGDGTLNGNKFVADAHGGALIHVDQSRPYAFTADVKAGDTHAVVDGSVTHPFALDEYKARINLTGKDLADVYFLTGLALPGTPPYQVDVNLSRKGAVYTLADLRGTFGRSDLSGNLTVNISGEKPDMRGRIASRTLYFDDMGALFGGGASMAQSPWLLPDTVLHTERLRQMDAEVDYTAGNVASRDIPLRGLSTHISLKNAVLELKPLSFGFTQGKLTGGISVDGRKDVPTAAMDVRVSDLHVETFIKSADKPVSGIVEARAKLSGTGKSVHAAAAAANGQVTAVMPSGQIRHSLAEWMGVNVISALGLSLAGDNSNTEVRCAVVHFDVAKGQMAARQFVFDTAPVRVDGQGSINLQDETLNLSLNGNPKSFQILRLHAPIRMSGKLASPNLDVDVKPAILQTAIGAGLGLVAGPAALLAFIDPGLAKDANCTGILTTAQSQGAPVKGAAVQASKARDVARQAEKR